MKQSDIKISGHAFEARIYAEEPSDNFLPQTGELNYLCLPDNTITERNQLTPNAQSVRLDTGVTIGDAISPYYDPMIAKLVVWDQDRIKALNKLERALKQYIVVGVPTNIKFLTSLSQNRAFKDADVGTDFIDLHHEELFTNIAQKPTTTVEKLYSQVPEICTAIYVVLGSSCQWKKVSLSRRDLNSFRLVRRKKPIYSFKMKLDDSTPLQLDCESLSENDGFLTISMLNDDDDKQLDAKDKKLKVSFNIESSLDDNQQEVVWVRLKNDDEKNDCGSASVVGDGGGGGGMVNRYKYIVKSKVLTSDKLNESIVVLRNSLGENKLIRLERENYFNNNSDAATSGGSSNPSVACAPMPGLIEKVLVSVGDQVERGQSLIIMSAMKMEYAIKAQADGKINELSYKPGDFVAKDSVLVRLEPTVKKEV